MKIQGFIISEPFKGNAQTIVLENGKVAYTNGLTLEEYLKDNPSFKFVTEEQFSDMHTNFYKRPFQAITPDQWTESLECLPPLKWHTIANRWTVFYCSEAYSGSFHSLYVKDRVTGLCYSGLKDIFQSDETILKEIESEILGQG